MRYFRVFQCKRITSILFSFIYLYIYIYYVYVYKSITIFSRNSRIYLHWTEEGCNSFVSSFSYYRLNAQNCTIPPWAGTWKLLAGLVLVVMKERIWGLCSEPFLMMNSSGKHLLEGAAALVWCHGLFAPLAQRCTPKVLSASKCPHF